MVSTIPDVWAGGVSAVVKRTEVSAWAIYVHYENKENMLAKVYMDVKAELHARVTDGLDTTCTAKLLTLDQQRAVDGYTEDIGAVLQRGIDDGILAPLDRGLLTLMLTAPAERLARRAILSGDKIPTAP